MSDDPYQSYRPSAYLDLWVWIRLARAAVGKPDKPTDAKLLEQLGDAADSGVAFPLSWSHYIETSSIGQPRQRMDLARVMASVSHFRTIRSRQDLLRNQLLIAMHDCFGRPTFRPEKLDPLGIGVHWAFRGVEKSLQVHDETGTVIDSEVFPRDMRIRATQGVELILIGGPRSDDEIKLLRSSYGYRPEATADTGRSRLEWELEFVQRLGDTPPKDPSELRTWIQAREVVHENLDLLIAVFKEYGIPISRLTGGHDDQDPTGRRAFITQFFDRMPSMQVAVDLKLAIHRNNQRGWSQNDIYDTDAMAIAVPYCSAVVADKAVTDALRRAKADQRHGTLITSKIEDLVEVLPEMVRYAHKLPDSSGWDEFSPGVGFAPLTPENLLSELQRRQAG